MTTSTRSEAPGTVRKAAYAFVGAPVMAGRRISTVVHRLTGTARREYDTCAEEGRRITGRWRERPSVEDLKERADLGHLQDRVGRLRDHLEEVLAQWRESFTPGTPERPRDSTGEPPE